MSIHKIAQRYAVALADLVLEKNQQTVIQEEVRSFSEMMDSTPELHAIFANPAFSKHQKERVLQSLLERTKPSVYSQNFFRLLLRNERLHHLKDIYVAYLQEMDNRKGVATAKVTTARPLRDDEQQRLKVNLEKLTGKGIRLETETNPDILGGVVVRIESEIYDGSILTQLEKIQRQLSQ